MIVPETKALFNALMLHNKMDVNARRRDLDARLLVMIQNPETHNLVRRGLVFSRNRELQRYAAGQTG